MQRVKGFTMIELIVVIVVIGILAAIAIPRFINQTSAARAAAINGMAGALNSAAALAQAQYFAEGYSSTNTSTTIKMNGTPVSVLTSGFPDSTGAGIGTALSTMSGFTASYGGTGTTATFTLTNAPSGQTNCQVVYYAVTSGSNAAGTAVATTSGC